MVPAGIPVSPRGLEWLCAPRGCGHLAYYTIGLRGDAALCVGGQALTQPHLFPRGIGDSVAKPAVGDLMDDINDQELVALQNGGDDEGEAGVLHGHDGEGGRQEDDVIPVPMSASELKSRVRAD